MRRRLGEDETDEVHVNENTIFREPTSLLCFKETFIGDRITIPVRLHIHPPLALDITSQSFYHHELLRPHRKITLRIKLKRLIQIIQTRKMPSVPMRFPEETTPQIDIKRPHRRGRPRAPAYLVLLAHPCSSGKQKLMRITEERQSRCVIPRFREGNGRLTDSEDLRTPIACVGR